MDDRLIPAGGKNPYADHPGFVAGNCELRITVTRSGAWGGVVGGFSCSMTGGHCLPCDKCGERRRIGAEMERREAEFVAARTYWHTKQGATNA